MICWENEPGSRRRGGVAEAPPEGPEPLREDRPFEGDEVEDVRKMAARNNPLMRDQALSIGTTVTSNRT